MVFFFSLELYLMLLFSHITGHNPGHFIHKEVFHSCLLPLKSLYNSRNLPFLLV